MLRRVDETLQALFEQTWRPPPPRPQYLFDPPDGDNWKNRVAQSNAVKLNVYLIDVRENPSFRRSEWDVVDGPNKTTALSRPPAYIDCHYLISAWSPAQNDSTKIEHAVLGGALRVLFQNPDVLPVLLGIGGEGPAFDTGHVYLMTAPSESSRALSDFWTSMKQPWRPAIQLIATAPLDLLQIGPEDVPMVTFIRRYTKWVETQDGPLNDEMIDVGGWVVRNSDGSPVVNADVLHVPTGRVVKTTDEGRFILDGLRRGVHRIRASAPGLKTLERNLDVPNSPLADHTFRLN